MTKTEAIQFAQSIMDGTAASSASRELAAFILVEFSDIAEPKKVNDFIERYRCNACKRVRPRSADKLEHCPFCQLTWVSVKDAAKMQSTLSTVDSTVGPDDALAKKGAHDGTTDTPSPCASAFKGAAPPVTRSQYVASASSASNPGTPSGFNDDEDEYP